MPSSRGKVAILAAALCGILCSGPAPALARKANRGPAVTISIVSKSQREVLRSGRVVVKVHARRGLKLIRVFVTLRPSGKKGTPIVITRVRELHIGRGHSHRLRLKLLAAGRRSLTACGRARLVAAATPIRKHGGQPGKIVRARRALRIDTAACKKKPGKGGRPRSHPPPSGTPAKPIAYQTSSDFDRCDFIDPADCLFPFPNDWFTTTDATTDTKRRVDFNLLSMPKNAAGKPIDPSAWNRNDGFSPGEPIVTKVPGLETKAAFDRTGIVPIDDMARAFDPNQPVVVIDAATKARHLVWAEVDANPKNPSDVTLIIRPGSNFLEGHRYIVALRRMRDAAGNIIQPSRSFQLYRDGIITSNASVESRRKHFESMFETLAEAGIDRSDLYRAWDFTVASERNLSERLLFMRNDAFKQLGDTNLTDLKVQGHAPSFSVTKVTDFTQAQNSKIARRVEGNFTVPCYLDAPLCPSGSRFAFDPTKTNGPPVAIPGNVTQARFTCNIPRSALSGPAARVSLYGHGLFGSRDEVNQDQAEAMDNEHNFVYCATDWIGMACTDLPPTSEQDFVNLVNDTLAGHPSNPPDCDVPNALKIETDLSNFPELTDRAQQGMLDFLYLGRLLVHPNGLGSDPSFKIGPGGRSVIDTSRLYYDGNSQGGIMGGGLMAFYVDGDRGVLGVPGMNYSTLLQRSSDFGDGSPPKPSPTDPSSFIPQYAYPLYTSYPNVLERQLILGLMQMLWDRSEADGYALHMTDHPLPGTPPHTILLQSAIGDHQVAQITAETEARTIGAWARFPWADPGRDLDKGNPIYGVPKIPSFPFYGSATTIWDTGPYDPKTNPRGTPPAPNANVPPSQGEDPHEYPRNTVAAREMKSDFLAIGGAVVNTCGDHPCYAWNWHGP
jgi:hypothetical protein